MENSILKFFGSVDVKITPDYFKKWVNNANENLIMKIIGGHYELLEILF